MSSTIKSFWQVFQWVFTFSPLRTYLVPFRSSSFSSGTSAKGRSSCYWGAAIRNGRSSYCLVLRSQSEGKYPLSPTLTFFVLPSAPQPELFQPWDTPGLSFSEVFPVKRCVDFIISSGLVVGDSWGFGWLKAKDGNSRHQMVPFHSLFGDSIFWGFGFWVIIVGFKLF